MKKQTLLLLMLAVLLLASCSTPEQIQNRKCAKAQKAYELKAYKLGCPWQISDSVIITKTVTEIRDTTIYFQIPGELVHDSILLPVPGINTPVNTILTKYAISKAWIENSQLKHTLQQVKSDISQIIQGLNVNTMAMKERVIKVPYPVEKKVEKELNWLQKFGLWSGGTAWLGLILFALFKFRKILLPRLLV